MSLLSDFTSACHAIAKDVIGTEPITIGGGTVINGVLNEASFNRDYEAGGFEQSGSLEFVIDTAAFVAAYPAAARDYEGKAVTARGETWRLASISKGKSFVTIRLEPPNKSA